MKRAFFKLITCLLCICICISFCVPTMAVNESNVLGVTFTAELNKSSISVSDVDQTVVMTVSASKEIELCTAGYTIVCPSPLVLSAVENTDLSFTSADYDLSTKTVVFMEPDAETLSATTLGVITFTIPANTPAGVYSVGVTGINLADNYGMNVWEDGASATTTLTITDANAGDGSYTAGVSTAQTNVTVGGTVYVTVSANADFSAAELTLSYPTAYLTYNEDESTLDGATVVDNNGIITLADYGESQRSYTLAFTATAKGTASVSLTSAAFSAAADAASSDLTSAEITAPSASVEVKNQPHNVTLNALFTGPSSVEDGADYTFSAVDSAAAYYNYTVTATMGGQPATVIDNGNGSYTIKNVTGALEISGTRTAKTYTIAFSTGSGVVGLPTGGSIPYGTDYSFDLPTNEHYSVSLTSIQYASGTGVEYTQANGKVTIAGTAITDNINVVIDRRQADAAVTVEGNAAADAAGYIAYATPGTAYTLTVKEDALYQYTVTAVANGKAVTLSGGNGSYTIAGTDVAVGSIVFTVNKVLKTAQITATQYITLNGTVLWLVRNPAAQVEGKVYQFRDANMYWSAEYSAYCTLVVSATKPEISAGDLKLIDGTTAAVDYAAMDVNGSGTLDANDAQFVYNMYMSAYDGITDEVTAEKYLRADVNGDAIVNTEDAVAIVAKILGN